MAHRVDKLSPEQNNRQFLSRWENLIMQAPPDTAEHSAVETKSQPFFQSLLVDQGQPNISNTWPHHTVQLPNCGPTSLIITPWCQGCCTTGVSRTRVSTIQDQHECPQTRTRADLGGPGLWDQPMRVMLCRNRFENSDQF